MITALHQVFGRQYGETFIYPANGTSSASLYFSTRVSDLSINWGDGSTTNHTTLKNTDFTITSATDNLIHNYSTPFIGDIVISSNVVNDIYSLKIEPKTTDKLNIQNFETFINQFKNLYSLVITNTLTTDVQRATLKGDLSKIPDSLERMEIRYMKGYYNNSTDFYLDVSNFSLNSKLKYFYRPNLNDFWTSTFNAFGDLSKLPLSMQFFKLEKNLANTFTYTAGRVWASSFDTLDLGNATMSYIDIDNLLTDMANSITTAIGSKVIRLANCNRTTASNPAVIYLESLGFTVIISNIITSNFTNILKVNDVYKNLTMNGNVYLDKDRNNQFNALKFINSGNLVSIDNIDSSSIISLSFWLKTSQSSVSVFFELSSNLTAQNIFSILLNSNGNGVITGRVLPNTNNKGSSTYNNNSWNHIVIIFNRNNPAITEVAMYKNNVLQTLTSFTNGENTGSFISEKIYIGGRSNTYSNSLNGLLSNIKLYTRELTPTEITNLYNE